MKNVRLVLILGALLVFLVPHGTVSHEPVTTNIRFNKEIVRIFQKHCLACHESGSVVLKDFASARPWARAFKEEVLEKRMPPYQPVKGFGSFHNDYTLTQHELDQIVGWVDGGAPKGDEKDLPKTELVKWHLGTPDVELKLNDQGDAEYRCVPVPTNLKKSSWLQAIDLKSSDQTLHCATFLLADNTADCNSTKLEVLGQWIPGAEPLRLPQGVGTLLRVGSTVLVKVHARKKVDASIGLYFTKAPVNKNARVVTFESSAPVSPLRIQYTLTQAAEAIAIRPLSFQLAKSIEATAYLPDGSSEVLIWTLRNQFDWQPTYQLKTPILLPKGTRVEVVAHLDQASEGSVVRLCELTLAEPRRNFTRQQKR